MGRGSYYGGGTVISVGGDISTKVGFGKDGSSSNSRRPRKADMHKNYRLQETKFLLAAIDAALLGEALPNPLSFWKKNKRLLVTVMNAGGTIHWVRRHRDYQRYLVRRMKVLEVSMPDPRAAAFLSPA